MIPNRQIQWTENMSRERFVQEVILRVIDVLVSRALDEGTAITDTTAELIAREALEIGYAVDEAFGEPTFPRLEGKV